MRFVREVGLVLEHSCLGDIAFVVTIHGLEAHATNDLLQRKIDQLCAAS